MIVIPLITFILSVCNIISFIWYAKQRNKQEANLRAIIDCYKKMDENSQEIIRIQDEQLADVMAALTNLKP